MARRQNFFAVLEGEEGDDVTKLIERVLAKVQTLPRPSMVDKNNKNEQQPHSSNTSSKSLPPDNVGGERGRGRGGQGRGSGRESGNDVKQFQNGHPIGYKQDEGWISVHRQYVRRPGGNHRDNQLAGHYHQDNGRSNGYCRHNGRSDGCSQDNRLSDVYRGDNWHTDGYQRNYGRKSADIGENNHAAPDGSAPVTAHVSKDAVCEARKQRQVRSKSRSENKTEVKRYKQKNNMTLEEYEKLLVNNKKALGVSKTEVRKGCVKDKLKKKGRADKDEKVHKWSWAILEAIKALG